MPAGRTHTVPVPRGRHAPPLEVRLEIQRRRLLAAAAGIFARAGYAEASAEAVSRAAGMSKATFYEHFSNKEECILALWDDMAERALQALVQAARAAGTDHRERHRAGVRAILEIVQDEPDMAHAVLVDMVGAGPRAAERRDTALNAFADVMYNETARAAARSGSPAYASPDDAFAIVGATFELVARHLRTGHPEQLLDLEPLIERLILGLLTQG
jgi:AcrR family transcriptional regulator